MPTGSLVRIALRNLVRHSRHMAFALGAIMFGVAGLAIADGFIRDLFSQLAEATVRGQLGHLQIVRPRFREAGGGGPEDFVIEKPASIRRVITGDSRVEEVAGRLMFSGVLLVGERELPVEVEGVEPGLESRNGTYVQLVEGADFARSESRAALLGEGVARQLGAHTGDLMTITAATLDGSLNVAEFRVAGVFRSYSKDFDDRAVRIRLGDAQELFGAEVVNVLVVHLQQTALTDEVRVAILGRPELAGLVVQPWYILADFYTKTRELYVRLFGILQLIALALIVMSVLTSFNITVYERTAELGTMRALGARPRTVVRLIVVEAAVLGVAGAILGVFVAAMLGALISWIGIPMPPPPNAESGFVARIMLGRTGMVAAAGIGVLASLAGALIPSIRVSRLSIVGCLGERI